MRWNEKQLLVCRRPREFAGTCNMLIGSFKARLRRRVFSLIAIVRIPKCIICHRSHFDTVRVFSGKADSFGSLYENSICKWL